jgi:effector-binding domain-containing protein
MPEQIVLEPELVAGVRGRVDAVELGDFFGRAMGEVMRRVPHELVTGPFVAIYHVDEGDRFDVTVGMPVSVAPDDPALEIVRLPAGPALRETHLGEYPRLGEAYASLRSELTERGASLTFAWERYIVGPGHTDDPVSFVTEVITPLTVVDPEPEPVGE